MNQEYNETKKNSTKTNYILCKTYLAISLQKTMKLLLGNQKPLFNCSIIQLDIILSKMDKSLRIW